MLIRSLPLIAGVVPFAAINLAYWIGVNWGPLPACLPYIDGCTSISATGRYPPGSFLFRAVEMPFSVLLVVVWYFTVAWLGKLRPALDKSRRSWILAWGIVGAIALIVYVTFLGTKEAPYEFMRRFGIYFYFLGTAVAQIFVSLHLLKVAARLTALRRVTLTLLWLSLLPFALGILNLVLKEILADPDAMENAIEWVAASLMQAWFIALYFAWKRTGFDATVSVGSTSDHS
jgi:hypothetical protein